MMETRRRKIGKLPLPGERQGTSGAGAGRDSEQATGGGMLNRRAPTGSPEQRTAEQLKNTKIEEAAQDPQRAPADKDVVEVTLPRSTLPVRNKQRTTWTQDMNEYVVRSFYRITKLETSTEPYGVELHKRVIDKFPQLASKTMQNILDQRRSIFKNNRLPVESINRIKQEVAQELSVDTDDVNSTPEIALHMEDLNPTPLHEQPEISVNVEDLNPILMQEEPQQTISRTKTEDPAEAQQQFETDHIKYHGLDPTLKPRLPKLIFKQNTRTFIHQVNTIIASKIHQETPLEEVHSLIYTGALTVLTLNEQTINMNTDTQTDKKGSTPKQAPWERRLCNKINLIRKNIGILTQYQRPRPSPKVTRTAQILIDKHKSDKNPTITEITDYFKQTLSALAKRLKRYRKSNKRRQQNRQFQTNQRTFYKSLDTNKDERQDTNVETPKAETLSNYWAGIWSNPVEHKKSKWYYDEEATAMNIDTMLNWRVSKIDVENSIKKAHNWKAPGPDKLHNFWYKVFVSTHESLARCFNELFEHPERTPTFMTLGVTYLLPKTANPSPDPSKYRPITCLPTIYKLFTSIISTKIYCHLENNKLLDEEQKGCRKGSRGCKEQLVIDAVITSDAKDRKQSLFMAYVDYQKAFDSVPHSWLLDTLKLYRVDEHIIQLLAHTMTLWKTNLILNTENQSIQAGSISIKRGIFQGDALSPLWFCIALRPLTSALNKMKKGYIIGGTDTQISHLWYMDDLKLFSSKKEDLQKLLQCVGKFSADIQMKFGLEKCRTNSIVRGKWMESTGCDINEWQGRVAGMVADEKYKYLGYLQTSGIEHKLAKETVTKTYINRLRNILRSELSAKNTSIAINTYATSVLTYTFGILKWTDTELNAMDITTRREFRKHRAHHPRSAVERFHLPRAQGGRGIPSIPTRHYEQVKNLRTYFFEKAEISPLHAAIVTTDHKHTPLRLRDRNLDVDSRIPSVVQIKQKWKSKPLHGRYIAAIEKDHFDTVASQTWLREGVLFAETEGFVSAIQDQVIPTRSYRRRIIKENLDSTKCRMCNDKEETLDHLLDSCSVLASKQYIDRHNRVAKIVHMNLITNYGFPQSTQPYYSYEPVPVMENDIARIYWDRRIQTDKPTPNNIPDIVVILKKEKLAYIIDIAVPLAANITKKHGEKINKYLPLADEMKSIYKLNTVTIVPIIVGSTGEIPYKLYEGLNILQLNKNLYRQIQKSVLLDACSMLRRVLGDSHWNG